MITENNYAEMVDIEHRKKFAQFFTPEPISDFMAKWVVNNSSNSLSILEPAFGLGIFSRSLCKFSNNLDIKGFEIDSTILDYAKSNFENSKNIRINHQDYITDESNELYDGIICNPPYLKFHDYNNTELVPIINEKLRTNLNKFTNIYSLFLMKSLTQLKEMGRCAYIVPSEFLNSDYGVEVKRFLVGLNIQLHFVIVNFEKNIFDGAVTTACIVLCVNQPSDGYIRFSTINNISELHNCLNTYTIVEHQTICPEIKWKNYYGNCNTHKYKYLTDFSNYAKVSRGIATGSNSYFAFTQRKANELQIPKEALLKCVCHCTDINKNIFTEKDFKDLAQSNKTMFLFNGRGKETDQNVIDYIRHGERQGVCKKYLCSKRKPWYSLEQRIPAPIWVSVFNRDGLKFIRNEANISNLTTFHCLYLTGMFVDVDVLFSYLLTDTAYQIFLDNSRQYGNGLIKFEPNDLNKAKSVNFDMLSEKNISDIKQLYSDYKNSGDKKIIDQINDIFVSVYQA